MTDKQIIIDGECLRCGAKTKKHILVCEKCTEEMGAVIAHKFTIDKQTREIKQLKKQLLRKEQKVQEAMDNYVKLDNQRVKEYNELVDKYKAKEQECEKLRFPMKDNNYAILTKEEFENFNQLKKENEELKKQLESTKGLVTVGNKQLAEAFKECEELKDKLNCCFCNPIMGLDGIENFKKCVETTECFRRQLDKLKAENEELKKCYKNNSALLDFEETNTTKLVNKVMKLEQTLTDIKPILEYYESSKIGKKQEDGSYKLEWTFSDVATPYCIKYDPRPAREALRKINEVEDEYTGKN